MGSCGRCDLERIRRQYAEKQAKKRLAEQKKALEEQTNAEEEVVVAAIVDAITAVEPPKTRKKNKLKTTEGNAAESVEPKEE